MGWYNVTIMDIRGDKLKMKFLSIRVKPISLTLRVLIPLVVLQINTIQKEFEHYTEMQLESNVNYAQTASKFLLNYIDELWIQQSIISTFFTSHKEPSMDSIERYLKTVLSRQSITKRIMWVSPQGTVLASSAPEFVGVSLAKRKYFQDILIGNLIDITHYDNGFLQLRKGNHDIVKVVEDITLSIESYAEAKG
jgi:C4-dicarboxylate-specific signal transduction histidine kinase